MSMTFPRKAELVVLMTRLNIVEAHEGKWYVTREFKDFIKDCPKKIVRRYSAMVAESPEVDKQLVGIIAMILAWDDTIPDDDVIEAAMFIDYWTTFRVCPFDRYGSEPVGVV